MPYTFTATDSDVAVPFADMKAFRAYASENLDGAIVHGTSVNNGEIEYGKLRYIKPVRMTTDTPSDVSLDDVLADIDRLEAEDTPMDLDDAQLIADMDGDGSDFEDDAPVTFPTLSDDEITEIVDRQLGSRGRDREIRAPRTGVRTSHKDCTHATAGDAGKKARAECRKARAAANSAAA